jgi:hypothetical protein
MHHPVQRQLQSSCRAHVESSNASGYDHGIGDVTLNLDGTVVSSVSTPEPATVGLPASGLGMLFFVVRRQRRRG